MHEGTQTEPDTHILVVDDSSVNRKILKVQLENRGFQVTAVGDGQDALDIVQKQSFDLILLDIIMPRISGYEVLELLKAHPVHRHIPVVVVSSVENIESVVRCIKLGAEDYLIKPFDQVLLSARIMASIEKKRLRDQEQSILFKLQEEKRKSEKLLLNSFPRPIAERLKQGEYTIADYFPDVTVLFADIVKFSDIAYRLTPPELVDFLNFIFSAFDALTEKHGLEKIKTIGDAYMVVGGLPVPRKNHAGAVAAMALEMLESLEQIRTQDGSRISMRIGISSGPVSAGVIGTKKFIYDLWGDTVNVASCMESRGAAGRIQVSDTTYKLLKKHFVFEKRKSILRVKGKGEMQTYFLTGKKG